jgi:hypothetical protein
VFQFNDRFSKFYNQIPNRVRPSHAYTLNYYLEAFDGILGIFLMHKVPQNLDEAQVVAIKLEAHILQHTVSFRT